MKNRGFSIVEVMFAIMILGVGFIMVAAMFPVAIQQSQANVDESTGRSVAAAGAVQTANAFRTVTPATNYAHLTTWNGTVAEFRRIAELTNAAVATQREQINTSVIYEGDRRFGWTSFYQYHYDATNTSLKAYSLITVALRSRNVGEQLVLDDAIGYSGYPNATWQTPDDGYDNASVRCRVDFFSVAGSPGEVMIDTAGANPDQAIQASVEGAILIVRTHSDPSVVGRIYHLEEYDSGTGHWYLGPKSDALPPSGLNDVEVYLLGRGLTSPNKEWNNPAGTNQREGLSQVVGVFRMSSALP